MRNESECQDCILLANVLLEVLDDFVNIGNMNEDMCDTRTSQYYEALDDFVNIGIMNEGMCDTRTSQYEVLDDFVNVGNMNKTCATREHHNTFDMCRDIVRHEHINALCDAVVKIVYAEYNAVKYCTVTSQKVATSMRHMPYDSVSNNLILLSKKSMRMKISC